MKNQSNPRNHKEMQARVDAILTLNLNSTSCVLSRADQWMMAKAP